MIDLSRFVDDNNKITNIHSLTAAVVTSLRHIFAVQIPPPEVEMVLLRKFIKTGDICIDVGANFGIYSCLMANIVGREGFVMAFEPHPVTYQILFGVLADFNFLPLPVTTLPFALSETGGPVQLALPTDTDRDDFNLRFGRVRLAQTLDWRERIPAKALKYDSISTLRKHPVDFVKIDVEGAELKVLRGMKEMLGRDKPVVLMEIEERHLKHYNLLPEDIFNFMEWGGFQGYHFEADTESQLKPCTNLVKNRNNYFFITEGRKEELGL